MLAFSATSQAWHHRHWMGPVIVGSAIVATPFYYGYRYTPYWDYSPPVYYSPPPLVNVLPAPVYAERAPPESAAAPQSAAVAEENWWYFCQASGKYYPYVQDCPAGWMRVSPRPAVSPPTTAARRP